MKYNVLRSKKTVIFVILMLLPLIIPVDADAAWNIFKVKRKVAKDSAAPDFSLEDTEGKVVDFKQYLGKKVIYLTFWTTWCTQCKKKVPFLNGIYEKYKDRDLVLLSVIVKAKLKKTESLMKKLGIKYPVLLDPKAEMATDYGVRKFPVNIVIDSKGIIRYYGYNPPRDFDKLAEELLSEIKKDEKPEKSKKKNKTGGGK